MEAVPDIFTISNLEGKIIDASSKALEWFKIKCKEDLIGYNLPKFIDETSREKAINEIAKMFSGNLP